MNHGTLEKSIRLEKSLFNLIWLRMIKSNTIVDPTQSPARCCCGRKSLGSSGRCEQSGSWKGKPELNQKSSRSELERGKRWCESRIWVMFGDSPSGGGGSAGWSSSAVVSTFLSCSWTQRKLLVWSEGESERLFFSPSLSLQWGRITNCFLVRLSESMREVREELCQTSSAERCLLSCNSGSVSV